MDRRPGVKSGLNGCSADRIRVGEALELHEVFIRAEEAPYRTRAGAPGSLRMLIAVASPGIQRSDLTLAILAGGKGERLGGVVKGLLSYRGQPFIEHVLALRQLCGEALIVSDDPTYDRFAARRVQDLDPERGAPGGVVTALLNSRTPWALVVACDMPFVTLEAARALIAEAGEDDVTAYSREDQLEPMLAVYRTSLGVRWRPLLAEDRSLRELIGAESVRQLVPHDLHALDSVNTSEQLAEVES